MTVQNSLLKTNEILKTSFSLALSIFELLQHQRDESIVKQRQRNHQKKLGIDGREGRRAIIELE